MMIGPTRLERRDNGGRIMTRRRLIASLLVAAVFAVPGPALAQTGDPVYNYYYYNNQAHSQQVGFARGTCTWYGVGADLEWGTYSSYPETELVGYCTDGVWEPL